MSKYANGGRYVRYQNYSSKQYKPKSHPLTLVTVLMDISAYTGIGYLLYTLLDKIQFISFVQSILF